MMGKYNMSKSQKKHPAAGGPTGGANNRQGWRPVEYAKHSAIAPNIQVERVLIKEIIRTGNLYGLSESFFRETAHKFIVCAFRYVERDKLPISLKTVCGCLCAYGLEEFAKTAESLFNTGDLWIPPM